MRSFNVSRSVYVGASRRAALLAVVVVLAACGSSSGVRGAEGSSGATPLDTSKGFALVRIDLSDRTTPLVLPIGSKVIVYGGVESKSGLLRSLDSGSVYDPSTDTWTEISRSPFPAALRQAGGVWMGKEALILGTPCEPLPSSDDGEVTRGCKPGGVVAATYNPSDDSWRSLGRVDSAIDGLDVAKGESIVTIGLGPVGQYGAFLASQPSGAQFVLLVDPDTGQSHRVEIVDRADGACATGGHLLAVVTGEVVDDIGGTIAPNPAAVAQPLVTYDLDTASLEWKQLSSIAKPNSEGSMFEKVVCSSGQLAYLPVKVPAGFSDGSLWWDSQQAKWQPLPGFEGAGFTGDAAPAQLGPDRLLIFGTAVYVLPGGADAWVRADPLPASAVTVGTVGDFVMTTTVPSETGLPSLGFLDIPRYLASSNSG